MYVGNRTECSLDVFGKYWQLLSSKKYISSRYHFYTIILVFGILISGSALAQTIKHQVPVKIWSVDSSMFDAKGNLTGAAKNRIQQIINDANNILAIEGIKLVWDGNVGQLTETGTADDNIEVDTTNNASEFVKLRNDAKAGDPSAYHIILGKRIDADSKSAVTDYAGSPNGATVSCTGAPAKPNNATMLSENANGTTLAHEFLHSNCIRDDPKVCTGTTQACDKDSDCPGGKKCDCTHPKELRCNRPEQRTGTDVSAADDTIKQQNVTKLEGYEEVDKDGKVIKKNVATTGTDAAGDVKDKATHTPTPTKPKIDINGYDYQYMGPWFPYSKYGSIYGFSIDIYGNPIYPETMSTYTFLIDSDKNPDTGGTYENFHNLRGAEYMAQIIFFPSGNIWAMLKRFVGGHWVYVTDLEYKVSSNYLSLEATWGSEESYVGDSITLYIPIELIEANSPTIFVAAVSEDDNYYDETPYDEVFYPYLYGIGYNTSWLIFTTIFLILAGGYLILRRRRKTA